MYDTFLAKGYTLPPRQAKVETRGNTLCQIGRLGQDIYPSAPFLFVAGNMSSSGLQRRRAGAANGTASGSVAGANGSYDDEDRLQSGSSSPSQSAIGSTSNGNRSTPGRTRNGNPIAPPSLKSSGAEVRGGGGSITVTSERGHRIAYDPRDLQDEKETADHPRLTLMEECLLLGLKDKQVSSLSLPIVSFSNF